MDQGRRRFLAASALTPFVLASACSEPPALMRVGGILWIGYEPLFLARDLGLRVVAFPYSLPQVEEHLRHTPTAPRR